MNYVKKSSSSTSNHFIIGNNTLTCAYPLDGRVLCINSSIQSYTVHFSVDLPWERVQQLFPGNVLLIDSVIFRLKKQFFLSFPAERCCVMEASEQNKSLLGVTQVLHFLADNQVSKSEQLIVIGGGTLQEVGAFAAKIYKRGIAWVHFPTTLLSMSDSCIGGKAGINFSEAKNQLGVFSPPSAVYIHHYFLETLSDEAIRSGLGEVLKACSIGGEYFLNEYARCMSEKNFHTLITMALSIKKAVVEQDEFERDERRCLNYGHTFGHAIEALSQYEIPHGLAVVLGMKMANRMSHAYGLLSARDLQRLDQLCDALLRPEDHARFNRLDTSQLTALYQKDKKTSAGITHFVLLKQPGEVVIRG